MAGKEIKPNDLLSMINSVDEKLDNLAVATSSSFNSMGPDLMKLAIQVVTVVKILVQKGIVTEESFRDTFFETATQMNEASQTTTSDDLEDIEV